VLQVEFTLVDLLYGVGCSFECDEKLPCEGRGICIGGIPSFRIIMVPMERSDRGYVPVGEDSPTPIFTSWKQEASLEMPLG